MKTMLLWLEAPLQSWGVDSRFGRRDSLPFPTRSGVLGLLCAASGRGGEQKLWLDKMSHYSQTILAYSLLNDKGQAIRQPLLCDFHMVGSNYDTNDPWQNMLVPKTIKGTPPKNVSGIKLTYRYYLQDMAFACLLEVEEAEELAAALQNPVWDISLGRKNCVPTDIVFRGLFDDAQTAAEEAEKIAMSKKRGRIFQVLDGAFPKNGEVITLSDVPIQFGIRKQYKDRQVTLTY